MKPKSSLGLAIGAVIEGEVSCDCQWIYAKFHPPQYKLIQKCDACYRAQAAAETQEDTEGEANREET